MNDYCINGRYTEDLQNRETMRLAFVAPISFRTRASAAESQSRQFFPKPFSLGWIFGFLKAICEFKEDLAPPPASCDCMLQETNDCPVDAHVSAHHDCINFSAISQGIEMLCFHTPKYTIVHRLQPARTFKDQFTGGELPSVSP